MLAKIDTPEDLISVLNLIWEHFGYVLWRNKFSMLIQLAENPYPGPSIHISKYALNQIKELQNKKDDESVDSESRAVETFARGVEPWDFILLVDISEYGFHIFSHRQLPVINDITGRQGLVSALDELATIKINEGRY